MPHISAMWHLWTLLPSQTAFTLLIVGGSNALRVITDKHVFKKCKYMSGLSKQQGHFYTVLLLIEPVNCVDSDNKQISYILLLALQSNLIAQSHFPRSCLCLFKSRLYAWHSRHSLIEFGSSWLTCSNHQFPYLYT